MFGDLSAGASGQQCQAVSGPELEKQKLQGGLWGTGGTIQALRYATRALEALTGGKQGPCTEEQVSAARATQGLTERPEGETKRQDQARSRVHHSSPERPQLPWEGGLPVAARKASHGEEETALAGIPGQPQVDRAEVGR